VIPWWEVLGVQRNATREQIKAAYRKASIISHPDKVKGGEHIFKVVKSAYEMGVSESEIKAVWFSASEVLEREKKAYLDGGEFVRRSMTKRTVTGNAVALEPVRSDGYYKREVIAAIKISAVVIPIVGCVGWPETFLPWIVGITVPMVVYSVVKSLVSGLGKV